VLQALNPARPFAGERPEQMTRLAAMDQDLADGQLPQEFLDVRRDGLMQSVRNNPAETKMILALIQQDRGTAQATDRKFYHEFQWWSAFGRTGCGAGLGAALTGGNPVGIAIGAALGLLWSLQQVRATNRADVRITHDGETRTTAFYNRPANYSRTPQEIRTTFISEGLLGDRIDPAQAPKPTTAPDPAKWEEVEPQLGALSQLDADRRLVADLGQRSAYGHDVVNLVDMQTAAELLATGQAAVFVVTPTGQGDVVHSLSAVGATASGNKGCNVHYQYIDRQFEYTLTHIRAGQSLDDLSAATGIPDGLVGCIGMPPQPDSRCAARRTAAGSTR
jgi:hypothetical protein